MSAFDVDELQTCRSPRGKYGWAPIYDETLPFICRRNEKFCPARFLKALMREAHKRSVCRGESGYKMKGYFMTSTEADLFNYIFARHCSSNIGSDSHFTSNDGMVSVTALYAIMQNERRAEEAKMRPKAENEPQPPAEPSRYYPVGWMMFTGVNTPYVHRQGAKFGSELIVRHRILNKYEGEVGAEKLWFPVGMLDLTPTEVELFTKYDNGRCGTNTFKKDSLVPVEELIAFEKELKDLLSK